MRNLLVLMALVASACKAGDGPAPAVARSAAPASSEGAQEPPVDPAALAVPGPEASACTTDAMCLNHRCNPRYGKCAFPCASDVDCRRGTTCLKAVISTCQARGVLSP